MTDTTKQDPHAELMRLVKNVRTMVTGQVTWPGDYNQARLDVADAELDAFTRNLTDRIAELEADNSSYITALAECRDAFPIPQVNTLLDDLFVEAIGKPECVPAYVKAQLEAVGAGGVTAMMPKPAPAAAIPLEVLVPVMNAPPSWANFIVRSAGYWICFEREPKMFEDTPVPQGGKWGAAIRAPVAQPAPAVVKLVKQGDISVTDEGFIIDLACDFGLNKCNEEQRKQIVPFALALISAAAPQPQQIAEPASEKSACWCQTCRPITLSDMRMVLCPTCGCKRCPHANDHNNTCTGSNESGQPGSAYPCIPTEQS